MTPSALHQLWRRGNRAAQNAAVLIGAALVWQVCVWLFGIQDFLLPAPSAIMQAFWTEPGYYLGNAGHTLWTTMLGFMGATVIGVALAFVIISSRPLERIVLTLLSTFHSIPKVALAPLFVIWLGTGSRPQVAIAIMISVFTIVLDTVVGLKSVDPEIIHMARSKRASGLKILTKIRMPHALPNLFGALKAATSFALIGAIVGEFVAGDRGLGYVILIAQGNFDTPRAFVALVMLGIMGTMLFGLLGLIEHRVIPWHVSIRAYQDY